MLEPSKRAENEQKILNENENELFLFTHCVTF